MDERIIEKLKMVTEEEKKYKEGCKNIERSLYMRSPSSVIEGRKLLADEKIIDIRPHTRFVHFPAHSHDFIEMVYMCKGQTSHLVNGKKTVLSEGELLILSPSAVQEIFPADYDDIGVNFIVLPSFFDDVLRMIGEEKTPLRQFLIDTIKGYNSETACLHFKVAEVLPIQNLIENLIWNLLNKESNRRNINQKTMALLFLHLMNCTDKLEPYNEDEVVVRVLRYIEDHYKDGSLSALSKLLHKNLYAISREIKAKTGKTYTMLLQEKRLSQACFYLKTTAMSIEDIALTVGYENISYFYKIFKNMFGVSPKKYRAKSNLL